MSLFQKNLNYQTSDDNLTFYEFCTFIYMDQFQCQQKSHNGKKIIALCVNRQCRMERKMCTDCKNENIHGHRGQKTSDIVNEQEIQYLIQDFKKIQDENQLLFEQKCIEKAKFLQNKVQVFLNKLKMCDQILQDSQRNKEIILNDCSLKQYFEKQNVNKEIGLYQYFDDVQSKIQGYQCINRQIQQIDSNPQLEQYCNDFSKFCQLNGTNLNKVKLQLDEINHKPIPQLIKYSMEKYQNNRKSGLKLWHINIVGFIITFLAIYFNFINYYKEEYQILSQNIQGYKEKSYVQCDYQGYYLKRGLFSIYISNYEQGIDLLQNEIELNPKSTYALLNIAKSYYKLGQYNNAIQVYQNVLRLDPESVIAYINKGNCNYQQNKFNQAIEMYNKALLIDPNHIDAMNNKGIIYIKEGMALIKLQQYQYALQQFGKAAEINKYFIKALYNKGITENILGLYDDASNTFDQLLVLAPDDKDILYQKGLNLYYQEKYEESNIVLDQIQDIDSLNQKSINLFKLKQYDQAVLVNDQVLKIDSTNKQAIKINVKSTQGIIQRQLNIRKPFISIFIKISQITLRVNRTFQLES
ncbi:hypothetical protein pb186bvf_003444 [Paramecium bursaria]